MFNLGCALGIIKGERNMFVLDIRVSDQSSMIDRHMANPPATGKKESKKDAVLKKLAEILKLLRGREEEEEEPIHKKSFANELKTSPASKKNSLKDALIALVQALTEFFGGGKEGKGDVRIADNGSTNSDSTTGASPTTAFGGFPGAGGSASPGHSPLETASQPGIGGSQPGGSTNPFAGRII